MHVDDSATYIKAVNPDHIHRKLADILSSHGLVPGSESSDEFYAAYTSLEDVTSLSLWIEADGGDFVRLYCSHPGLFTWHSGDGVTILSQLCQSLGACAADVATDEGCGLAVYETDGKSSCLSGHHHYMIDELYEHSPDLALPPGFEVVYRGARLPWMSFDLDIRMIPQLADFSVGDDVCEAIPTMDHLLVGRTLPPYFVYLVGEAERNHMKHYARL